MLLNSTIRDEVTLYHDDEKLIERIIARTDWIGNLPTRTFYDSKVDIQCPERKNESCAAGNCYEQCSDEVDG
jgi:hypothetical protein